MRRAVIWVLALAAADPVWADSVTYTFDVTDASLTLVIRNNYLMPPDATLTSSAGGTFAISVLQSDLLVDESDTFLLEDANLANSEQMIHSIGGMLAATIDVGSARLLDFAPVAPAHIDAGGIADVVTDLYGGFTLVITGYYNDVVALSGWTDEPLSLDMVFSTPASASDVLTVSIGGTYHYLFHYGPITPGSIDFVFQVEGTAHVVPDPSLSGLTALGLGGAGTWLRRRRP